MQVRSQHVLVAHAVLLGLLVVAQARVRDNGAERLHALVEVRAACVVLVTHHGFVGQGAAQGDVAYQSVARCAGASRGHAHQAQAGHLLSVHQPLAAQHLVAAANGKQRAHVLHVCVKLVAHGHDVGTGQLLLAVGAAAHHDQVDAGKVDGVAVVHAADLHGDAAPCQALLQHAHVAAVAVQVQQVGEQVRDDHGVLPVRHIFAGRRAVGTLGSEIARRGRLSRGGLDFAACGHGCVKRGLAPRQRRVVRDDVRAHLARLLRDAMQQVVGVVNGLGVYAGVLQAHCHVASADASGVCRQRARLRQLLEVDVPQPRHVAPVGLLVVDEKGHHLRRLVLRHDLEVLVEAGGILRQVQQDAAAGKVVGLQAPVLRIERVDGLLQRLVRASQQACGNAYGGKVVHHIGAAEAGAYRERPFAPGVAGAGLGKRERQPVGSQPHIFGGEIQGRAREAAVRAAPFAQLPVLTPVVFEHGGAALAHGGVEDGVLRQAHALGHAEGDGARALAARQLPGAVGDGCAQRVVGVVDQHGFRRAAQRLDDAVLDAVDLAAAIKLVAEQVEQHHVVRAQLRQDLCQPQLVALEHAPVGLAGV